MIYRVVVGLLIVAQLSPPTGLMVGDMAIAFDNSAQAYSAADVDDLSTPSFAVAGSDRVMVALAFNGTPDEVRWGGSMGQLFTQVGSSLDIAGAAFSLWRLVAPTAQTSTGFVSYTTTGGQRSIIFASYTGVDQTTPLGTESAVESNGTASSLDTDVTAAVDDLVIAAASGFRNNDADRTMTFDVGITSREEVEESPTQATVVGLGDKAAASTTVNVGFSTSANMNDLGLFGVALKQAGGGGAAFNAVPNLYQYYFVNR